MKLKVDEDGHAVIADGMPVYIHEDGTEAPFDALSATTKITELNQENTDRRHKNKELEETLKVFEGLDPDKAKKAIETVENLDAKKLIDAGEVETLKKQLTEIQDQKLDDQKRAYRKEIEDRDGKIKNLNEAVNHLMISSNFAKSPYFSGENPKTILPPDMAAEYFGKYFRVEGEGRDVNIIGYIDGEKILSRQNLLEPATFEEAIGVIIDKYPMKDRIMRASTGGSGSQHNITVDGDRKAITLSRKDAQDPQLYRLAKEKAEKAGVPIKIA